MKKQKEVRVDEIINAAVNEFLEKGFDNASMDNIAARASLSKGGLYHHFKSKSEILFTVNMKLTEPVLELFSMVEADRSVTHGLKTYIDNYLNFWNNNRKELTLYFMTMNESFSNTEIMNLYREMTRQTFDFFESQYIKGQKTGLFRKIDARAQAIALVSCLDGLLGYLLIDPSISIEKLSTGIKRSFIDNILISHK